MPPKKFSTVEQRELVSRHFFRRTAQKAERRYTHLHATLGAQYLRDEDLPLWITEFVVERARRGPFMWYVVGKGKVEVAKP